MEIVFSEVFERFALEIIRIEGSDSQAGKHIFNLRVDDINYGIEMTKCYELCDEDKYEAFRVSKKPECNVCGDEDAYHKLVSHDYITQRAEDKSEGKVTDINNLYLSQQFTIHPECLPEFEERVRGFIEDNSDVIVSSTI